MSELTLHQRARIDAYFASKSKKLRQERYNHQRAVIIILGAVLFVCGTILIIAMNGGIETDRQLEIYEAYKSRPHEAAPVEFQSTDSVAIK